MLLIILVGLALSFTIRTYTGKLNPLFSDSDHAILLALQYKINDPSLYAGDQGIAAMAASYPKPVNWVMAQLLKVFSIEAAYLLASFLLYVLFISGLYVFVSYLTGNLTFSSIFTILSIFGQKALNGIGWGIQFGHVLPRDLFIALSPWLFLALLHWKDSWKKLAVLFFCLGVLANVHFLSVLYLAGICAAYLAATNLPRWKKSPGSLAIFTFLCIILFSIGALPYFFQYSAHSHPLFKELVHSRMPYLYEFPLKENFLYLTLPVILAVLGYRGYRKSGSKDAAEQMLVLFCCIATITGVGILAAHFLVNIAVLQFYRVSAFAYIPLFFFAAMFLTSLWRRTTFHKFAACFVLLITAIPLGLFLLQSLPRQPLAAESVAVSPVRHWDAFVEASNWIQEHTPKQALFFVPPLGFESFRVMAQRGILVSYKDGSTLILMDNDGGISWQQRYQDAQDAYAQGTPAAFNAVASTHHATYLLIDTTKNNVPVQSLFSNSQYAVYALPLS